jgi:hypothetical protein
MTAARALRAQQKAMPVIGFLSAFSPGLLSVTSESFAADVKSETMAIALHPIGETEK